MTGGRCGETKLQHDFATSLAISAAQVDAPWWELVYRQAFPDFSVMHSVRCDGWAQRGGIDRVVSLASGKTITVDEKVRQKDYPDLLWEYLSDVKRQTPGWAAKDMACDYIAYAYIPSRKCYLLPALQVRKAWIENGKDWISKATSSTVGFRVVNADNGHYTTRSVAVPIKESFRAIQTAMIIRWAA